MAINSCDEQWRMQWDAVQNLRILNKFYYAALESIIDQFAIFLKGQIENLRSNNSRNAMCLFWEIFSQNAEKCPEGRKVNDTWAVYIEINMAAVFKNTNADKKFLSMTAQKAMLAVAEVSPIPQTSSCLINYSASKTMAHAEFALRSLEVLCKTAPTELYHEQHYEEQCLQIVHCLCEVLEQKQAKKVKYAKPALQHI